MTRIVSHLLTALSAAALAVSVAPNSVDGQESPEDGATTWGVTAFLSRGTLGVLGHEMPVELLYSSESTRIHIIFHHDSGETSSLFLDWSTPTPVGKWAFPEGCFEIPLESYSFPAPAAFSQALAWPDGPAEPDGVSVFAVDDKQRGLLLNLQPISLALVLGSPQPLKVDIVADSAPECIPINGSTFLGGVMIPNDVEEQSGFSDQAPVNCPYLGDPASLGDPAHPGNPWIEANRNWSSGSVAHKESPYQIGHHGGASTYDRRLASCKKDNLCEPSFTIFKSWGAYGWQCGAGRGEPEYPILSPTDKACEMHDRKVWSDSDALNWCGLHHALTCRASEYNGSWLKPSDWKRCFPRDYFALKKIHAAAWTLAKGCWKSLYCK